MEDVKHAHTAIELENSGQQTQGTLQTSQSSRSISVASGGKRYRCVACGLEQPCHPLAKFCRDCGGIKLKRVRKSGKLSRSSSKQSLTDARQDAPTPSDNTQPSSARCHQVIDVIRDEFAQSEWADTIAAVLEEIGLNDPQMQSQRLCDIFDQTPFAPLLHDALTSAGASAQLHTCFRDVLEREWWLDGGGQSNHAQAVSLWPAANGFNLQYEMKIARQFMMDLMSSLLPGVNILAVIHSSKDNDCSPQWHNVPHIPWVLDKQLSSVTRRVCQQFESRVTECATVCDNERNNALSCIATFCESVHMKLAEQCEARFDALLQSCFDAAVSTWWSYFDSHSTPEWTSLDRSVMLQHVKQCTEETTEAAISHIVSDIVHQLDAFYAPLRSAMLGSVEAQISWLSSFAETQSAIMCLDSLPTQFLSTFESHQGHKLFAQAAQAAIDRFVNRHDVYIKAEQAAGQSLDNRILESLHSIASSIFDEWIVAVQSQNPLLFCASRLKQLLVDAHCPVSFPCTLERFRVFCDEYVAAEVKHYPAMFEALWRSSVEKHNATCDPSLRVVGNTAAPRVSEYQSALFSKAQRAVVSWQLSLYDHHARSYCQIVCQSLFEEFKAFFVEFVRDFALERKQPVSYEEVEQTSSELRSVMRQQLVAYMDLVGASDSQFHTLTAALDSAAIGFVQTTVHATNEELWSGQASLLRARAAKSFSKRSEIHHVRVHSSLVVQLANATSAAIDIMNAIPYSRLRHSTTAEFDLERQFIAATILEQNERLGRSVILPPHLHNVWLSLVGKKRRRLDSDVLLRWVQATPVPEAASVLATGIATQSDAIESGGLLYSFAAAVMDWTKRGLSWSSLHLQIKMGNDDIVIGAAEVFASMYECMKPHTRVPFFSWCASLQQPFPLFWRRTLLQSVGADTDMKVEPDTGPDDISGTLSEHTAVRTCIGDLPLVINDIGHSRFLLSIGSSVAVGKTSLLSHLFRYNSASATRAPSSSGVLHRLSMDVWLDHQGSLGYNILDAHSECIYHADVVAAIAQHCSGFIVHVAWQDLSEAGEWRPRNDAISQLLVRFPEKCVILFRDRIFGPFHNAQRSAFAELYPDVVIVDVPNLHNQAVPADLFDCVGQALTQCIDTTCSLPANAIPSIYSELRIETTSKSMPLSMAVDKYCTILREKYSEIGDQPLSTLLPYVSSAYRDFERKLQHQWGIHMWSADISEWLNDAGTGFTSVASDSKITESSLLPLFANVVKSPNLNRIETYHLAMQRCFPSLDMEVDWVWHEYMLAWQANNQLVDVSPALAKLLTCGQPFELVQAGSLCHPPIAEAFRLCSHASHSSQPDTFPHVSCETKAPASGAVITIGVVGRRCSSKRALMTGLAGQYAHVSSSQETAVHLKQVSEAFGINSELLKHEPSLLTSVWSVAPQSNLDDSKAMNITSAVTVDIDMPDTEAVNGHGSRASVIAALASCQHIVVVTDSSEEVAELLNLICAYESILPSMRIPIMTTNVTIVTRDNGIPVYSKQPVGIHTDSITIPQLEPTLEPVACLSQNRTVTTTRQEFAVACLALRERILAEFSLEHAHFASPLQWYNYLRLHWTTVVVSSCYHARHTTLSSYERENEVVHDYSSALRNAFFGPNNAISEPKQQRPVLRHEDSLEPGAIGQPNAHAGVDYDSGVDDDSNSSTDDMQPEGPPPGYDDSKNVPPVSQMQESGIMQQGFLLSILAQQREFEVSASSYFSSLLAEYVSHDQLDQYSTAEAARIEAAFADLLNEFDQAVHNKTIGTLQHAPRELAAHHKALSMQVMNNMRKWTERVTRLTVLRALSKTHQWNAFFGTVNELFEPDHRALDGSFGNSSNNMLIPADESDGKSGQHVSFDSVLVDRILPKPIEPSDYKDSAAAKITNPVVTAVFARHWDHERERIAERANELALSARESRCAILECFTLFVGLCTDRPTCSIDALCDLSLAALQEPFDLEAMVSIVDPVVYATRELQLHVAATEAVDHINKEIKMQLSRFEDDAASRQGFMDSINVCMITEIINTVHRIILKKEDEYLAQFGACFTIAFCSAQFHRHVWNMISDAVHEEADLQTRTVIATFQAEFDDAHTRCWVYCRDRAAAMDNLYCYVLPTLRLGLRRLLQKRVAQHVAAAAKQSLQLTPDELLDQLFDGRNHDLTSIKSFVLNREELMYEFAQTRWSNEWDVAMRSAGVELPGMAAQCVHDIASIVKPWLTPPEQPRSTREMGRIKHHTDAGMLSFVRDDTVVLSQVFLATYVYKSIELLKISLQQESVGKLIEKNVRLASFSKVVDQKDPFPHFCKARCPLCSQMCTEVGPHSQHRASFHLLMGFGGTHHKGQPGPAVIVPCTDAFTQKNVLWGEHDEKFNFFVRGYNGAWKLDPAPDPENIFVQRSVWIALETELCEMIGIAGAAPMTWLQSNKPAAPPHTNKHLAILPGPPK
jgi:hypothetical protein